MWREDYRIYAHHIKASDGVIDLDYIGRYEKYEESFYEICRLTGIYAKMSWINKSSHDHYSTYYDEESMELVSEFYKEEIELFGYEFATEN